jgi:hypothetical protein
MDVRRAALAVIVLSLFTVSLQTGAVSARASTVAEAEQRAEQAESAKDDAYAVVSEAAENRAEIEAQLFEALNRYDAAVTALADSNRRLEQVGRALAAAEAESVGVSAALTDQIVAAYMQAVLTPGSIVVGTDTVEQAMMVDHVFTAGQTDNLAQLDQLTVQKTDLARLRSDHEAERRRVEELEAELAVETENLQRVFARADDELAAAYQRAANADASYRAALSDVDRARAAEELSRQDEQASTTTTVAAPDTTGSGDDVGDAVDDGGAVTTTTTTPPPDDDPPPGIRPEVERWRATVAGHFPASRVEEALLIIQCESNGDPDAVNAFSGASGLFQFLPGTWAVASLGAGVGDASVFDPGANAAAAAWLFGYYEANGRDGWTPWTCRYYL